MDSKQGILSGVHIIKFVNFGKHECWKLDPKIIEDNNGTAYLVYKRYPFVRGVRFKILEEQLPLAFNSNSGHV
jgi:hypothetical protein